ncbi:putative membrane protein [Bacilli bacterium PM5-3]|nr:putative membrane protein [Bacilli bacterium PM5-3]MDH6604175.1 putative membrane protein [Bacilli bacterium PM5-9]
MKTRDIAIIGVLIALSYLLSFIKFSGSIALDSTPAFLATFLFRDYKGPFVAGIGHMLSAASAGFLLGLPVHISIAILMFVMLVVAGKVIDKTNVLLGSGVIFIINAFIMPFIVFISMPFSWEAYSGFVVALAPAAIANIIIAAVLYRPIGRVLKIDGFTV